MNNYRIVLLTATLSVGAVDFAWSAEWQAGAGFRSQAVGAMSGAHAGFTLLMANQTGVWYTNLLAEERSLTNQIYQNGSGVALGDVDGDGLCDIYQIGRAHV